MNSSLLEPFKHQSAFGGDHENHFETVSVSGSHKGKSKRAPKFGKTEKTSVFSDAQIPLSVITRNGVVMNEEEILQEDEDDKNREKIRLRRI